MTLEQLFDVVERLRRQAIGEPRWIDDKKAYEYSEHSAKVVAVLKLVRAAHGVSALRLLCARGLFTDFGVIMRCVNDCRMEIFFLLEEFPKKSGHVDQFVKAFFETAIDGYLSTETHSVPSKKIRNAMLRVLQTEHDQSARTSIENIYKTFSGYVHANYAHIMEMYNGATRSFNLAGVPDVQQRLMRTEHVQLAANAVLHLAAFIAQKIQVKDLHREIIQKLTTNITL